MECLKCKVEMSHLMNWDTLTKEFVECTNCGNKMVVEYEEYYNDDTYDVEEIWYFTQYIED